MLNGEQAKEFNDLFGKKVTTGLAKKTADLDISANDSRPGTPTLATRPASGPALNKRLPAASLPAFGKTKDTMRSGPSKTTTSNFAPNPKLHPRVRARPLSVGSLETAWIIMIDTG